MLALYAPLCECITSHDPRVREAVGGLLQQLGRDVGLAPVALPAPAPAPPPAIAAPAAPPSPPQQQVPSGLVTGWELGQGMATL